MTGIDRNPERVLSMILDMQKTYTEYFNYTNETDKKHDKIRIWTLGLEQDIYISKEKREQEVRFLQK